MAETKALFAYLFYFLILEDWGDSIRQFASRWRIAQSQLIGAHRPVSEAGVFRETESAVRGAVACRPEGAAGSLKDGQDNALIAAIAGNPTAQQNAIALTNQLRQRGLIQPDQQVVGFNIGQAFVAGNSQVANAIQANNAARAVSPDALVNLWDAVRDAGEGPTHIRSREGKAGNRGEGLAGLMGAVAFVE